MAVRQVGIEIDVIGIASFVCGFCHVPGEPAFRYFSEERPDEAVVVGIEDTGRRQIIKKIQVGVHHGYALL
jgi:hypothetical protein